MPDYIFPVVGGSRITSGFGRRNAPTAGASTNHGGIDIAPSVRGRVGQQIVAPTQLRVTHAGRAGSYGNAVYGVDANGIEHRFGHLNSVNVRAGQTIDMGTQLGTLGNTGRSSGAHLHYETRKNGKSIDPSGLLNKAKKIIGGKIGDVVNNDALRKAASAYTGGVSDVAFGVTDGIGLTGECGWLCQFQNWIKESGFFQRLALAVFAFILLFAAFYLMKTNVVSDVTSTLKKAVT
jgi:hypothetical protein